MKVKRGPHLTRRRRVQISLLAVLLLSAFGAWGGSNVLARVSAVNVSYTSRVQPQETSILQVYETASGIGFFRQTATRLLKGPTTDADRLDVLMQWTYDNVRPPYAAPDRVVSDNAYSIVRRGFGYCDQSAHVFATLAHYAGYDVHLLFLRRADGASPHTVARVAVGGRWVVVDPFTGVVWRDATGRLLTVEDLQQQPELLDQLGYEQSGFTVADFTRGTIFQTFPYQGSKAVIAKVEAKLRKSPVAPGSTLPTVVTSSPAPSVASVSPSPTPLDSALLQEQMILFDRARRAHLDGEFNEAVVVYKELLREQLDPEIDEAAHFFLGLALLRSDHYTEALATFDQALLQQPHSAFRRSLFYYRGIAKESLHDIDGAVSDLEDSNTPLGRLHAVELRAGE